MGMSATTDTKGTDMAATKGQTTDDSTDQTGDDSQPKTARYKVIQTRVNRIVDGELQPARFGDVLELDPNGAEAKRLLSIQPPAIIALDDTADDQQQVRGNLDATPPGPPAGSVPAGSAGAPIGNDSPAELS